MPSLPRIITVDPVGNVARLVRATIDLSEYACRQIDVPTGKEALEEMRLGGAQLIVSALDLEDMSSMTLAEEAQALHESVAVVLMAEEADPFMTLDEQRERGVIYFQRPLDLYQFSEVVFAAMREMNVYEALRKANTTDETGENYGPVPSLNTERAGAIVDRLLVDLGAMSIMLIGRDGSIVLERGADNFLDRDALISALMPSVQSNIDMRELVGGDSTVLQFFDGDHRDVYTLSVGLHHLLSIAYHGEKGQREFGMVNRLGRTAAMDLIALLGAEAFMLRRAEADPRKTDELPRRTMAAPRVQVEEEEDEPIQLERAVGFASEAPEMEKVQFDAISDDDFDPSFLDQLGSLNIDEADDLFSMENLEKAELNVKLGKTLSDKEASDIGLFDS